MVVAQNGLKGGGSTFEHRLGLVIAPPVHQHNSQVVATHRHLNVLRPKHPFADLEALTVQLLGLIAPFLVPA